MHQGALWEASGGSVTLWTVFCWDLTICGCYFGCYYLNIVAEQLHLFMATVLSNGSDVFQQDIATQQQLRNLT